MGLDIPKQFIRLKDGRTVLETCVDAFHQNEHIDEIAIVMHPDHKAEAQALLPASRFPKIRYWIPGGAERWESSKNAVEAIYLVQQKIGFPEENINVLLHDCARPFISQDLITRVCIALLTHEAVSVAVPVTDTIYVVENSSHKVASPTLPLRQGESPKGEGVDSSFPKGEGVDSSSPKDYETVISEVPSRAVFRRAQTPQAFRLSVLKEAFEKVKNGADCKATDDAGVVRYCLPDIPIHILPGEESNRKITYKEDIV
jgi:2-C-methyl-D-erythritol 4-phosphate cytidylyltransferase